MKTTVKAASVTHIFVTVGEHKLKLTIEEARALKKALDETLEPRVTHAPPIIIEWLKEWSEQRPYFPYQPSPIWVSKTDEPTFPPNTVVCDSSLIQQGRYQAMCQLQNQG